MCGSRDARANGRKTSSFHIGNSSNITVSVAPDSAAAAARRQMDATFREFFHIYYYLSWSMDVLMAQSGRAISVVKPPRYFANVDTAAAAVGDDDDEYPKGSPNDDASGIYV